MRDRRSLSRLHFLREVRPSRVVFFFGNAGSFLDIARKRSGFLVKFRKPPRSSQLWRSAEATFPTLLFSFGALAATPPRCFPQSPDMVEGLPSRVFASRGTPDIAEIWAASLLAPRQRSPIQGLGYCLFEGSAAATGPQLFCRRYFLRRLITFFFVCYVFASRDTVGVAGASRTVARGG